jgi:hypothetical protein
VAPADEKDETMTMISAIGGVGASLGSNASQPGASPLGAMQDAMDTAASIGVPNNAADAASILATGRGYLAGCSQTLGKLDEGIRNRTESLAKLEQVDPTAAAQQREQIDLLNKLAERIRLSMERVADILAGKDRDDIGRDAPVVPIGGPWTHVLGVSDRQRRVPKLDDDVERALQVNEASAAQQRVLQPVQQMEMAPDAAGVAAAYAGGGIA